MSKYGYLEVFQRVIEGHFNFEITRVDCIIRYPLSGGHTVLEKHLCDMIHEIILES